MFADPESGLRGTVTHESLQRVLDHIMASDWPADIVAVTGDLIQDDSAEAYERFCELFSQLDLPIQHEAKGRSLVVMHDENDRTTKIRVGQLGHGHQK